VEILIEELAPEHAGRFTLVHEDILKSNPTSMIREWAGQEKKAKVIGNLPYYISTPILFHLIGHAEVFSKAVLMLQKEVAARLTAQAGDEDYSRLSVTSRFYGETDFLFDVSPACFLPRPEVMSRVISYTFRPFPSRTPRRDDVRLLELVRIAFSQRRKTLLSLLAHDLKPKRSRENFERIFEKLNFSPNVRGETLSLEQFILLSTALETSMHDLNYFGRKTFFVIIPVL